MGKIIDLTGERFGHLTVIERSINNKHKWLCKCDCGVQKEILGWSLSSKNTSSCGCSFQFQAISKSNTKHGHCNRKYRSPEYNIWASMKARCTNKKLIDYKDYGGRGIQVCGRWMESFQSFLDDMGVRPSSNHSLDRIDVNGNYEPSNCKWSTSSEQSHNKRMSSKNKTGYTGVMQRKGSNRWVAQIKHNHTDIYLGTYDEIESAIKARKEAEIKYWGKQSS